MPAKRKPASKDYSANLGCSVGLRPSHEAKSQESAQVTDRCYGLRVRTQMPAPYKGRIYDPGCGPGDMFTLLKDRIQQINPQAKVFLYGQELNPQTWAIARSEMLKAKDGGFFISD